ncbi:dihydrodipicolinate synthase family protein [Chryseolinea sp. H1M3-3]|uniref:dihydrodipicolinate synthase family protein n=1 Tax=Chryseolinea sp. H1M3-3 TaxID=3034144 RepID=UPI0023ED493C|nr:dihydrodipicolinate synthase family protein [Chryseolinea sp. H1M3-3]
MNSNNVEILNATFTPMDEDGMINYERIPDLFRHCINTGANGIFLNGTTGECMSLSVEERLKLVETWTLHRRELNRPDFKIFVHVGSCNLYETARMAEHAQSHGVDGIAMVATFYFRPKTLEELVEQCEYVAAAASKTPFYYYNIPFLTGVNFPLISFLEIASRRIPNFAGLKNSFTDIVDYQHCIHFAKENYSLYWGTDEAFMMLYAAGNRHYVGSTYNYMGDIYQQMLQAHQAGDLKSVVTLEGEADAIYKIILKHNGITAGKEIMRFLGIDCGTVRKPLKPFTKGDSETLLRKLRETTFFHHNIRHVAVSPI